LIDLEFWFRDHSPSEFQFSSVQPNIYRWRRTLCKQSQRRLSTVDGPVLSVANTGRAKCVFSHAWRHVTSRPMIVAMLADRSVLSEFTAVSTNVDQSL